MRVLLLGGDGYLGRPQTLHQSLRGDDVRIEQAWNDRLDRPDD